MWVLPSMRIASCGSLGSHLPPCSDVDPVFFSQVQPVVSTMPQASEHRLDGPESHLLISSPEWDPSYHLLPGPGARSAEIQPLGQIPCYDLCLLGQVPLRNGSRNWSWDGDGPQALVPVAHFGQIMEFPCLAHHPQLWLCLSHPGPT